MRTLALLMLLASAPAVACTSFITSQAGRTLVGCNEDAWSTNANVRFERGRTGTYGAIYFAHYNGHPLRQMADQMGMNEAGLIFDGLSLAPGAVKRRTARPPMETADAIAHVMRTCATVEEAATFLRSVNTGPVSGMLFFADAQGGYLMVEPDTLFTGSDPWYAVSNWRMSTCTDPAAIPIPRLQEGRLLLGNGAGRTLEDGADVLSTMSVCRSKLGEGTLFSVLFDPGAAQAHLYFYHDFSERVTFDLRNELRSGDRTVAMASLFSTRPEYERLRGYYTPFHQRWLFWALAALAVVAMALGIVHLIQFAARVVASWRGRQNASAAIPFIGGLTNVALVLLLGLLLVQEPVFYFGLGYVHPALVVLPWLLLAGLLFHWRRGTHERSASRMPHLLSVSVALALVTYWGLWW
ncbi:MAG: hypothetical protein R2817_08660 [Flavobacteriales bacterium]